MLPSKGMEDRLTIWSFLSFKLSLSGQILREFLLLILNMIFVVSLLVSLDFLLILYHTTCVPFFFFLFPLYLFLYNSMKFLTYLKKKKRMQIERWHIPMNFISSHKISINWTSKITRNQNLCIWLCLTGYKPYADSKKKNCKLSPKLGLLECKNHMKQLLQNETHNFTKMLVWSNTGIAFLHCMGC